MSSIFNWVVSAVDILGLPIHLRVQQEQSFKTPIGAIGSLSILSFLTFSLISLITGIYDSNNVMIQTSQGELSLDENYTFEDNKLMLAVNLFTNLGQLIKNDINYRYYNVRFTRCNQYLDKTECEEIQPQICDSDFVALGEQLNLQSQGLQTAYCMNRESRRSLTLQGSHRMNNFTEISIIIQKCVNNTKSAQICAPDDEINKKLYNANLLYGYSYYSMDSANLHFPYKWRFNVDLARVQPQSRKQIYLNYMYSEVQTTQNLLYFFPKTKKQVSVEFLSEKSDSFPSSDTDPTFVQLFIKLDNQKMTYYRSYPTLLDVFAKLGGLFTLLRIIATTILAPIQTASLKLFIINQLNNISRPKEFCEKVTFMKLIRTSEIRKNFLKQYSEVERELDIVHIIKNLKTLSRQMEELKCSVMMPSRNSKRNHSDGVQDEGAQYQPIKSKVTSHIFRNTSVQICIK